MRIFGYTKRNWRFFVAGFVTALLLVGGCTVACAAGVPVKFTVETSRADVQEIPCYHGETLDFDVTFKNYGRDLVFDPAADAQMFWQTNGMNAFFWRTNNVTVVSNKLQASFIPSMDPGNGTVFGFIGVPAENYRAAFVLRFKNSPGAKPKEMEWPYRELDFDQISVVHEPYYKKSETYNRTEMDGRYMRPHEEEGERDDYVGFKTGGSVGRWVPHAYEWDSWQYFPQGMEVHETLQADTLEVERIEGRSGEISVGNTIRMNNNSVTQAGEVQGSSGDFDGLTVEEIFGKNNRIIIGTDGEETYLNGPTYTWERVFLFGETRININDWYVLDGESEIATFEDYLNDNIDSRMQRTVLEGSNRNDGTWIGRWGPGHSPFGLVGWYGGNIFVAWGENASATNQAYAFGKDAKATHAGALALGNGAEASQTNSVAIGAKARSHGAGTITLGDAATSAAKVFIGDTPLSDIGGEPADYQAVKTAALAAAPQTNTYTKTETDELIAANKPEYEDTVSNIVWRIEAEGKRFYMVPVRPIVEE